MPDDSAELSFGYKCMQAIADAKRRKQETGQVLTMKEVAEIIDRHDAQRKNMSCPDSSGPVPALFKSISSQFGNRNRIPPTPEQVTAYSAAIGYPMDGQKWCDAYAVKGWKVGNAKMKDWQAAVRNWKTSKYGMGTVTLGTPKPDKPEDYTKI